MIKRLHEELYLLKRRHAGLTASREAMYNTSIRMRTIYQEDVDKYNAYLAHLTTNILRVERRIANHANS